MKKITFALLIVMVALFAISCASAPAPVAVEPSKSGLPEWVLNPPIATDAIYGVGYAKQSNQASSLNVAKMKAREDIANQINTTIQSAITAYTQEAGVDDNVQTISFMESITRQITDQTLSGASPLKTEIMSDGGVWVMMIYGKESLVESFEEVAKEFERNEDAAFAEFKAASALEKLEYTLANNPTQSEPQK